MHVDNVTRLEQMLKTEHFDEAVITSVIFELLQLRALVGAAAIGAGFRDLNVKRSECVCDDEVSPLAAQPGTTGL